MTRAADFIVQLHDHGPSVGEFAAAVRAGLRNTPKSLPCKFLYDWRGGELFEQICQLPEYYPTRTELALMSRYAGEMAGHARSGCTVVEYGSGSSLKTRILLDALDRPAAYVPIDICKEQLLQAARRLAIRRPDLSISPVCADYTQALRLPELNRTNSSNVAYFPGSTIGNFDLPDARVFLHNIRRTCGAGSGLLIGVDLKKDPGLLHAAYNDAAGVTAAFNLNLLARVNRELDGNFDLDRFTHYAGYNPLLGRVEMHLVCLCDQVVRAAGECFVFREGESIFTESSYKYTLGDFERLAHTAGYRLDQTWTDDQHLFSVHYLTAA